MSMFALLRSPRHVLCGVGQRGALGTIAAGTGTRALVCTDARFGSTREFAELEQLLRTSGLEVTSYTQALPDVPVGQLEDVIEAAHGFSPDLVIGMGGGSCIDLAKMAAILLVHGGAVADYYGEFRVPGPVLPVIALPTTAGTGSEVTPVAVVTDPARINKVGVSSPHIIPHAAICDPELTYGAPPALTASAGADALSHAIESFTAVQREPSPDLPSTRVFVGKNTLADEYALLGIRLISRNLLQVYTDPDDGEARAAMMLAATAGGFALGTAGTAAAHAIQYPVGAVTHTPHGLGVGTLLPYVMEYNRPVRVAEFAAIAQAMGIDGARSDQYLADAAIEAVAELLASVGIPRTLAELGLPEDKLRWTAEQSLYAARLVENNPRKLDLDGAQQIVRAAYYGDRDTLRAAARNQDDQLNERAS
jgi:alcohol dehydrogenase class IV